MAHSHSPPALSSPLDRTRPKQRVLRQYRGARRAVRSQARIASTNQALARRASIHRRHASDSSPPLESTMRTPSINTVAGAPIQSLTLPSEDDVLSTESLREGRLRPPPASLTKLSRLTMLPPHGPLGEITNSPRFFPSQPDASVRQLQSAIMNPLITDKYILPSPPNTYYNKPAAPSPLPLARRSLASSSHLAENAPIRSSQNAINLSLTPRRRPNIRTKPLAGQTKDSIIQGHANFSTPRASSSRRTALTPSRNDFPRPGKQLFRTPPEILGRPYQTHPPVVSETQRHIQEPDSIFSPSRTEGDLTLNTSFFVGAPLGTSTPFLRGNHHVQDSILDADDASGSNMDISVQMVGRRPGEADAEGAASDNCMMIQEGLGHLNSVPSLGVLRNQTHEVPAIKIAIHGDSIISSFEQSAVAVSPKRSVYSMPLPAISLTANDDRPPNTSHSENCVRITNIPQGKLPDKHARKQLGEPVKTSEAAKTRRDDGHEIPSSLRDPGHCHLGASPQTPAQVEHRDENEEQAIAGDECSEHRSSTGGIMTVLKDNKVQVTSEEGEPSPTSSRTVSVVRSPIPTKIRVFTKRPLRWKGKRVAMSSLDPMKLWMRVHDHPLTPEGSDDEPDALLF
ncbi:hypothetical protein FRB93_001527 [Tulasnella sp. JGI-2019a]|nr:hypothetical protein FRB93_001527 [Tulasnella sp. JGI-2019a]